MHRRHFVSLAGAVTIGTTRPALGAALTGLDRAGSREPTRGTSTPQLDPRFDDISRLIEAKMAEYRVPGVAFGLSKSGASQTRGFGLTNVDNPQAVTPDTVFPLASISKTVTATAMMRLHDQGRIDIEAPVREYLPDFRVADANATRDVRIWHLLTHTPGWHGGPLGTPDRGSTWLESFVEGFVDLPQFARPGEVWSYNNAAFGVAGRVVEVVTESTIGEALSDLVFDPLRLERAFTRTGEAMTYRFAAGHRDRDGRSVVIRPFQLPANVSAGGCAMSVENLIRYAEFHLGDGAGPDGGRLLTRRSLEAMRTARITKNSTTDEMGLGWHLRTLEGVLTAQHGGTLGGHRLHVQLVPARNLAFAILTNHGAGQALNEEVATVILDTYEGLALAPGQATGGNRGGTERMTLHAEPLATQPVLDEYVGRYPRPPAVRFDVVVRVEGGRLMTGGTALVFWGPDLAYQADSGLPVEFIRDDSGVVTWIRVNGIIARKEGR